MLFPHMIHHKVKHFTAQIETEHFERVLDFLGRVEKYCYPILMISLKQNLDNVSPKHSMETKEAHKFQFIYLILRATYAV